MLEDVKIIIISFLMMVVLLIIGVVLYNEVAEPWKQLILYTVTIGIVAIILITSIPNLKR